MFVFGGTVAGVIETGKAVIGRIASAGDLVADVEARVADGSLQPGERLDPVRALAEQLGLAPNTVAAAYRMLGERGVVVAEGRRGTFVSSRPPVAGPFDDAVADGLIDLSSGNPDPALLPELGPAFGRIDTGHATYGDPAVDDRLGELLRAELRADGVEVGSLAVVGGALDGIERTLAANLRPGDRVGIEDPGYASVRELVAAMGLRPIAVPIDRSGPRPDAVEAAAGADCRAIVITPRAHNPTGAALSEERAAALQAVLATMPDVLIVVDDHAGRVAGRPYRSVIGPGASRWAVIRSVAKSLGPDLRLAALTGDETKVARVSGRQALGTGWVPHIVQRIVADLLGRPDTTRLLERAATRYGERRAAVADPLVAAGLDVEAGSGMNVWVPVADEAAVVVGMQQRGYAIRSGSRFRTAADPGVRISTAASDPATLAAAAEALLSIVGPTAAIRSV